MNQIRKSSIIFLFIIINSAIIIPILSQSQQILGENDTINQIDFLDNRDIMLAIEGSDFSNLDLLRFYSNVQFFWNVGCALITDFSGSLTDLMEISSFSVVADVTDLYLETTVTDVATQDLTGQTLTNANTINASSLWSLGYNGTGVKIGNIDTGLNDGHIDFTGRVMALESFISTVYGYSSNDSSTTDPNGHGSHTTGIIAGDGSGNSNYIGIAPECEIYFAKVGNPATAISVVAALDWLVTQGVEVINLSYGGGDSPGLDIVETAFRNVVRNHGILCSISAGNEGADGFYSAGTPGTTDDVITVGNIYDASYPYSIAASSSKGPTADNHMKPDVLAPGQNIYSCYHIGDGYTLKSGTSMAAPQVTGAIALLIQACKVNGFNYNPGVLKAALLKTAVIKTPISTYNLLTQGRGVVNVGAAWNEILNSAKEGNISIIGACNPVQEPLHLWQIMKQGQIIEQYLSCVTPFKTDLSIELTGSAAAMITVDTIPSEFTAVVKLTFVIPDDAALGVYLGQLNLKYKTYLLDTVELDLTVEESNLHKILINFRTTDFSIDHMYGQFNQFVTDALDDGYVVCEQNITLTSSVLNNYDAVWLPDPFNYRYPFADYDNYGIIDTDPVWADGELDALTTYVENGGTVFFCFNGQLWDSENSVIVNTNITMINEFTEQYGISVRDTIWTDSTTVVNTVGSHSLIYNVDAIDHYGGILELSGDAQQLTELELGSDNATAAVTQTSSGGRVIVVTTNFVFDYYGYTNQYNPGFTQNNLFAQNLLRFAASKHRIKSQSIDLENGNVNINYNYLKGPGANFGGYLITPSLEFIDLNWSNVEGSTWQTTYSASEIGLHKFFIECGDTGLDDFDYIEFDITELPTHPTNTPTSPTETTGVLFSILGLMSLITIVLLENKIRK